MSRLAMQHQVEDLDVLVGDLGRDRVEPEVRKNLITWSMDDAVSAIPVGRIRMPSVGERPASESRRPAPPPAASEANRGVGP